MPAEKLMDSQHRRVQILSATQAGMTSNNASSQALVTKADLYAYNKGDFETGIRNVSDNSLDSTVFMSKKQLSPNHITRNQWMALIILTFVNLINYMDRYTIAGKAKKLALVWLAKIDIHFLAFLNQFVMQRSVKPKCPGNRMS